MKNLFEKISKFNSTNPKYDLLSYGEKAIACIKLLSESVGKWETKYVQNAVGIITAFPSNYSIINNEVLKVEAYVKDLMRNSGGGDGRLPSSGFFRGGTILFGKIPGTETEVKLPVEQLSGNTVIYGQYGMGKTNLNQLIIPQIVSQGVHVDIFDVTNDYRDLLLVPECRDGLVFDHETDRLNPLEPIGSPDEHLQFFWEITRQDFNIHEETKEMLFNYSFELYERNRVREGNDPPTLFDLRDKLEEERERKGIGAAGRGKIDTAIRKLNYILNTFGKMVACKRSYPLDVLDRHPINIREVSKLSEDKRSWYTKLYLRRFYYKEQTAKERHDVKRVIGTDESKATFGKSVIGEASNFLKDVFTKSRSKGDVYIIADQFATELAEFTRAANLQLSFHHTVPNQIREIATAMAGDESTRAEIPKLGRYKALMKITDFPYPFPVVTYKSKVPRHIDDSELARLMAERYARLNNMFQKTDDKKRVRVIVRKVIQKDGRVPIRGVPKEKRNVLDDLEMFLRHIKDNPNSKVTEIYKALKFSGRKGNSLKTQARENRLIQEKIEPRQGKGRPSVELELTEMGKEYLNEKR